MELQALIFDVDGTLAETERDGHRVAFNRAFRDVGLDWDWSVDLYGKLLAITGGKERMRHYIDHYQPAFKIDGNTAAFIADLHRRKTTHYTAMVEQGAISLRPGVTRLLQDALHAGIRLAIATTTSPDNVAALLTHTLAPDGIDWFEVVAAGDIVPAKKPAPDIYIYALNELGLPADACLAIEDSANGVASATGAGIGTVVTVSNYTAHERFDGALLVVDGLGGDADDRVQILGGAAAPALPAPLPCIDIDLLRNVHALRRGT